MPKRMYQLCRHDPSKGTVGDCQRTVLACLLGYSRPDKVPHFQVDKEGKQVPGGAFFDAMDAWLAKKGYRRWQTCFMGSDSVSDVMRAMGLLNPGTYYMLCGLSERGLDHVVICFGDALWHDTHPDGGGIVGPGTDGFYRVEVLVPLALTERRVPGRLEAAYRRWRYRAGWLRYLGADAAKRRGRRWGGGPEPQWGPFTLARDRSYRRWEAVVTSGGSGDRPCLRLAVPGYTLICELPKRVLQPWRRWVDTSHHKVEYRPNAVLIPEPKGYWDQQIREYGFCLSEAGDGGRFDYLTVSYGPQTHGSESTKRWSWFLPWAQQRTVRQTMLNADGSAWAETLPEPMPLLRRNRDAWRSRLHESWDAERALEKLAPVETFLFEDYDGERLTAKVRLEEREWHLGEGWFRWLGAWATPRVIRYHEIEFSGETGNRKGSWKGGTLSTHGPTECVTPAGAFMEYCAKNRMTYLGRAVSVAA